MFVTTIRVLKFGYFETKCYEMTKQLYLGLWASKKEKNTTSIPQTLKVEENKVVLFFCLKAFRQMYGRFMFYQK